MRRLVRALAILLGIKGFTKSGLPVASTNRITGIPAKVIGIVCILIGLAFLIDGTLSVTAMIHNLANSPQMRRMND